jgi:hypothetical protein
MDNISGAGMGSCHSLQHPIIMNQETLHRGVPHSRQLSRQFYMPYQVALLPMQAGSAAHVVENLHPRSTVHLLYLSCPL